MKEPKLKTVYVCSNCGETSPRWMGRCPSCGSVELTRRRASPLELLVARIRLGRT